MPKKIDLTGQIFGEWTVIREATKEEHASVHNYVKEHSIPTGINFNDLIN